MRDTDQSRHNWQRQIEQRINDIEAENERITQENEKLKSILESRQEHGLHVTRRQALGGLLGGGALLGMGGAANAKPDDGGDPFADEGHDHGGENLGQDEPVTHLDSSTVSAVDKLNNVAIVRPGDDIQAVIDSVYEPGDLPEGRAQHEGNYSGMVRFLPNHPDDRLIYEFPDPPYVVRPGVTLDIRGIVGEATAEAKALFDLRFGTEVIGHGAYINAERNGAFTGACWYVDGDAENRVSMRNSAKVHGFPTFDVQGGVARPILLELTDGGAIGGTRFEVNCGNTKGIVRINAEGDGWINDNVVYARGSVAGGDAAVEFSNNNGSINDNYVWFDSIQIKPGTDRILYCDGNDNKIHGNFTGGVIIDWGRNVGKTVAEWTSGVGRANPLLPVLDDAQQLSENGWSPVAAIDNSGSYGNRVGNPYRPTAGVWDLSEMSGAFDGEIRPDDGSNTAHRGVLCCWDNETESWIRPDGTGI